MRIRTFRFLAGGSTPSKTREVLLRFMNSVTAAIGGSNDDRRPTGFLWSPSTAYVYMIISLLVVESLLPRGGVPGLTSVVLLRLSSGSSSVRGEAHPLLS
jgi:hypothetical protein